VDNNTPLIDRRWEKRVVAGGRFAISAERPVQDGGDDVWFDLNVAWTDNKIDANQAAQVADIMAAAPTMLKAIREMREGLVAHWEDSSVDLSPFYHLLVLADAYARGKAHECGCPWDTVFAACERQLRLHRERQAKGRQ
jgi:hypothetical protein